MPRTARVFMTNRSQAVRLPKEYQFATDEVFIRKEGEEVILLGSSSSCCVNADVWAGILGTIPYEILCGISPRIPRVYI